MFGFLTLGKKYGLAMDAPIFNGDMKLSFAMKSRQIGAVHHQNPVF